MAHLSTGRPENRLLAVAAGVVFYGLLALFPAITAVVSLYGLFANAATINDHLSSAAGVLPAAATDIIHEQIVRLTSNSSTKLGFAFISGLVIALWSANAGMKSVIDALNVVYGEQEKRGFFTLNLISLTFTLGMIVLVLLGLGAVVVLPLILAHLGLGDVTDRLFRYSSLADFARRGQHRISNDIPLRPKPPSRALAMAICRDLRFHRRLDGKFGISVLVSF